MLFYSLPALTRMLVLCWFFFISIFLWPSLGSNAAAAQSTLVQPHHISQPWQTELETHRLTRDTTPPVGSVHLSLDQVPVSDGSTAETQRGRATQFVADS